MKLEIASLRLIGCGPFDDVTLDFCDDQGNPKKTILLAGANGSGKSTVLNIIAFLFNDLIYSQYSQIFDSYRYVQLNIIIDEVEISIGHGNIPDDIVLSKYNALRNPERTDLGFKWRANGSENIDEILSFSPTLGFIVQIIVQNRQLKQDLSPPCMLLYPAKRRMYTKDGVNLNREEYIYNAVRLLEVDFEFNGSLSSYLLWLEYSDGEEFSKTVKFLNELEINKKKFSVSRKNLQAVVELESKVRHDVTKMSHGEQAIFMILLDIYRRITKGSIVMIDEVEESLHPAFQYQLIYALEKLQKEWDFQLIITSHSVDILEAIGPGKTLFLTDYDRIFQKG